MKGSRWIVAALSLLSLTAPAHGDYLEVGDSGDLPGSAQFAPTGGPLTVIRGTLSGYFDADMYAVYVSNPSTFAVTTDGALTSAYDTQLFLFDASGRGVVANDDISHGPYNPRSTLPASGAYRVTTPGLYYLAISGWDRDPMSAGGEIFNDDQIYNAPVGPNGPGGALALSGWNGDASGNGGWGAYGIYLTGAQVASAVPEPGVAMLLVFGAALASRRRRA